MTEAANSLRRRAARLGPALLALSLPALLWAAPAGKRPVAPPRSSAPAVPRVIASILGVKLGMDLDDARSVLKPLGAPASAAAGSTDPDTQKSAASDTDADEGHQEVWRLNGTPYARLAFGTDDKDKITYVTGFVRTGQEIPFAKIGDLAQASGKAGNRVLWNVVVPHNLFRVLAGGKDGKASVVSLISLHPADPNGVFSPQIPAAHKVGTKK